MIPVQKPKCRTCWRRTANLGGVCAKCLKAKAKLDVERLRQVEAFCHLPVRANAWDGTRPRGA